MKKTSNIMCFILVCLCIILAITTIVFFFLKGSPCNGNTLPPCESDCIHLSLKNSDPKELFSAPVFRVYADQIVSMDKQPRCFMKTNKGVRELFTAFSYAKTGLKGQVGLGFDQYAIVLANPNPQYEQDLVTYSVELYLYTDINYWSFNWNNNQGMRIFVTCKSNNDTCFKDWSYTHSGNIIPDPFTKGNDSIGHYLNWTPKPYPKTVFYDGDIVPGDPSKLADLPLFRIDQQLGGNLSKYGFLDGWRAHKCFDTYLFAPIFIPGIPDLRRMHYGLIRIPVPKVYTGPYDPLQEDLDVNYFSISTSYDPNLSAEELKDRILPFWTANGRMLENIQSEQKDQKTSAHLSYVMWVPATDLKELIKASPSTDPAIPPIVECDTLDSQGNSVRIKAYVLGYSDYCWIFRYRTPNPEWAGSPEHTRCVETVRENGPIVDETGWIPRIKMSDADSLTEFLGMVKSTVML